MKGGKYYPLITIIGMTFLLLGIFLLPSSLTGFFLTQETHTLDLQDYSFQYQLTEFNDSNTSKEFDFPDGGGNKTYYIQLPKNSTVQDASLNLTGKITTIYETLITENGLLEVRIDNVTSYPGNEIISGSGKPAPNIFVINGSNGKKLWQWNLESENNDINSIAAGNIDDTQPGKEIVFTVDQLNKVVAIASSKSGGSFLWEYVTPTTASAIGVDVTDLDEDGSNDVVFSDGNGYVYKLSKDGTQEWNLSLPSSASSIHIKNITSDPGKEIVAGANKVHLINSTGSIIWNKDLNSSIEDVYAGNVTSDPGNEIAVGTTSPDNKVYLLNTTDQDAKVKWYVQLTGYPMAVTIGDATTEPAGNEIIVGDNDQYAYAFSHAGEKIWSYRSDEPIESADVNELTEEPGVEVATGGMQGSLYTFNFNYFPTNLSIDVGEDGTYNWKSSTTKLRTTEKASGTDFESSIENFLDTCSPNSFGNCQVPLLFHSDFKGKLNISNLNFTYRYNTSGIITKETVNEWSRREEIQVNESVGNKSIKINFNNNPANDILVNYVRINNSSNECDFNGTKYTTTETIDGEKVCDISDFTLPKSGELPSSILFWEDIVTSERPVLMNSSDVWYTESPDNYNWNKNLTIWNETENIPQTFYNVTANITINDTEAVEDEFLKVHWDGNWCSITPDSTDEGCDSSTPSFEAKACGDDTFYTCKEDIDNNGKIDFFRWKQPKTLRTNYITGGSTNYRPGLSNFNVSPEEDIWGANFTYNVDVSDNDGDNVSVTLFVKRNNTDTWQNEGTETLRGGGSVEFNLSSDKKWSGVNRYKFEYYDYNTSDKSQHFHNPVNTSIYNNPTGLKHNVSFFNVTGKSSKVNRSESNLLEVQIRDTTINDTALNSTNTSFWVNLDGNEWDSGHYRLTNSSGHVNLTFTPDGNYTTGKHWWNVTIYDNEYYNRESKNYTMEIHGKLHINLTKPEEGDVIYRNETKSLEGELLDQYNRTAKVSGYNCTFWRNGSQVNNTTVDGSSGLCSYSWGPDCTLNRTNHRLNVTLWGSSDYYTIQKSRDSNSVQIWDKLNLTIDNPLTSDIYHKNETLWLNSTVNDTCFLCSKEDYNVTWQVDNYKNVKLNLTENSGINRTKEPYTVNGSYLRGLGVDIDKLRINNTRVLQNGTMVPHDVRPWKSSSKTELNYSKEYMDNLTEIVFFTNVTARQKKEYILTWNESNPQPYNEINFIRNGGFEGGDLDGWDYNNINYGYDDYPQSHSTENESFTANYSAYIMAESQQGDTLYLNQTLDRQFSGQIKMVYKAWGDYDDGSYIKIISDAEQCNLGLNLDEVPRSEISYWNETSCDISSTEDISVTVHDQTDNGFSIGGSHLLIDYICLTDETGECINPDTGAEWNREINTRENINESHNFEWNISENRNVGERRIYGDASGQYYKSDSEWTDFLIYGWSELTRANISSDYCTYNSTGNNWICGVDANITGECWIEDKDTSEPIEDHEIDFFLNDTEKLGLNETDDKGKGIYHFNGPGASGSNKLHNLTCNVTDESSVFYNSTVNNTGKISFVIRDGDTTGVLLQEPNTTNATDITRLQNYTFTTNITLVNNGTGNMLNPEIVFNATSGIYADDVDCPPLGIGDNCSRSPTIYVTQNTTYGYNRMNVTAKWQNEDGSSGNATNFTGITVENNTELNITEPEVGNYLPAGYEGTITNFTVEAFGNTEIEGITFNYSGQNTSTLRNWTFLNKSTISTIDKAENRTMVINGSIPADASSGQYLTTITANATNSSCDTPSECWDSVTFNLTVEEPNWYRLPERMNKTIGAKQGNGTIGEITIDNNLRSNQTFNLSLSNETYLNLSKDMITVNNGSKEYVKVFHNRSSERYTTGTWLSNLTIDNLNGSSPSELKTEIELEVVNLTVDVIQPNTTNFAGPLNASDEIHIKANVSKPSGPVTENVSFEVSVGDSDTGWHECVNTTPITPPPTQYDVYYWDWNCTAPNITQNHINNTIRVEATSQENLTSYKDVDKAVRYYDVVPPRFSEVAAEPFEYDTNKEYKLIKVNITDNTEVNSSSLEIDTPTESGIGISNYSRTGTENQTFVFNFTIDDITENSFPVGDYEITIKADDTGGIYGYGGQTNSTIGWFDVYKPVNMSGNMSLPTGDNINANFSFYRENRTFWSKPIHKFSSSAEKGSFNWKTHKRGYDVEAEMFGHKISFDSLNTNQSVLNQNNTQKIEQPFRFDNFPNSSYDSILITPGNFENPLLGFVVEENENLAFDRKTITLDYSDIPLSEEGIDNEDNLRVLKCTDWVYEERECNSTEADGYMNTTPNTGSDTIEFSIDSAGTGYILAEGCFDSDGNLIHCSGYQTVEDDTTTESSSSGGGGGGGASIPEEDEGEEDFPFDIDSNIDTARMFPGESKSYWTMITNNLDSQLDLNISMIGTLDDWVDIENRTPSIGPKDSKTVTLDLEVPEDTEPGTYSDVLVVESGDKERSIPLQVEVSERGEDVLSLDIEIVDSSIYKDDNLQTRVNLNSVGSREEFKVNITYLIRDSENRTVLERKDNVSFDGSYNTIESISFEDKDLKAGNYKLQVLAEFDQKAVKDMATFQIMQQFWASTAGQLLLFLGIPIALIVIIIGSMEIRKYYLKWQEEKEEEQRYLFPVDYSKIPQKDEDNFWLGRIADTEKEAWYDSKDLKTHILVAGATGSGKSVAASVFAEEALENDVPVVVFDPTAQWTGFMRRCQDDYMLKYYGVMDMDKDKRKGYPGMIHKMEDPEREVDFDSLMEPGEITVFTLNDLKPKEFDQAVRNIIDSMFDINWEESEELKLVVVFDEVHRLLEKYGGEGGYKALEKACREFRKWGIGIIMCSQVLNDFKEAVAGNVLTDVQLNTKAMEDINKAESKYGERYAKRISRQGIGVGMMQHPQHNDGDPWFVRFRPTWHNPHKLEEDELEQYEEFSEELDKIEQKIKKMEEEGKDIFDLETSLRMAKNKLKSGDFRMAEIYVNSLKEKLE